MKPHFMARKDRLLLCWIFLSFGIFFGGCKVNIVPDIIDGSKSDAVLVLAYEYNQGVKPSVNWDLATENARKRCQDWGYANAKLFDTAKEECISKEWDQESCLRWRVTLRCQCVN